MHHLPLRLPVLLACSILLATCGGSGSPEAVAPPPPVTVLAACSALIDGDGIITMPLVKDGSAAYSYAFTPDPHDGSVFTPARTAANAAASDCGPVTLPTGATPTLVADMKRYSQKLSVSLKDDGQGAFRKVAASITGGNLNGFVGELTPVANGTVNVVDATGAVLATGNTNKNGSIIVSIDQLPDSFRVVVTGGTMSGAPFLGSLQAEVRDYATISDSPDITVTPLTTIISAYTQRYPGLSMAEVMEQVKDQLGIPQTFDADSVGLGAGDYFDSSVFYAEAKAAGSVDTEVDNILNDWENGTPHAFAPAVPVDRQEASELLKVVLPPEDVPNFKTGTGVCGAGCMSPQISPLDVAGFAFSVYSGVKTSEFQADVVDKLNKIHALLTRMESSVGKLASEVAKSNYKGSKAIVRDWKNLTDKAFKGLHWLVNNPASGVMPADLAVCDTEKGAKTKPCIKWADWQLDVETHREAIAAMLKPPAAWPAPMAAYQEAVAGDGPDNGMLRDYRTIVLSRIKDDPDERLFFTSADSNLIWDHYQYWLNEQALTYFFFADYYIGRGTPERLDSIPATLTTAKVKGLTELHEDAVKAAGAAMPARVLPPELYIDYKNTQFRGNVVGGPLMWQINNTLCSFGGITFDAANVVVQKSLVAYYKCMNDRSQPWGGGLTGWRLSTVSELFAFTQIENSPSSDPTKGLVVWLTARGIRPSDASQFSGGGTYVYAAYTNECSGTYRTHGSSYRPPCSDFSYYFDYKVLGRDVTWLPFIKMGSNHVLQAAPAGTVGRVLSVRPVADGEYW